MRVALYLTIAVAGYLMGSIPFGYLLVRLVRREDIRSVGSGNIGATNVLRSGSKGLGGLTFLLDAAKGFAAVYAGEAILLAIGSAVTIAPRNAEAMAGLCAILGHVFPIWLGLRGGKGVATGFGVFLAWMPAATLLALGVFVVVFVLSRYVSLASILAAATLPLLGLWLDRGAHTPWFLTVVFFIPALIVAKHHQNIRRLLSGTEFRFGKTKGSAV